MDDTRIGEWVTSSCTWLAMYCNSKMDEPYYNIIIMAQAKWQQKYVPGSKKEAESRLRHSALIKLLFHVDPRSFLFPAIGVTTDISAPDLQQFASSDIPGSVQTLDSYSDLTTIIPDVMNILQSRCNRPTVSTLSRTSSTTTGMQSVFYLQNMLMIIILTMTSVGTD